MIINLNKQNVWLTSDLHFYHKKIIDYCYREFDSVKDMNYSIVDTINSVCKNGMLINLGDFGLGSEKEIHKLYSKIKVKQIGITGNHDKSSLVNKLSDIINPIFRDKTVLEVHYNGVVYSVYLSHKPSAYEYVDDDKSIFIYGHLHEKEVEDKKWNQINVGWDRFKSPIELKQIIQKCLLEKENERRN